MLTISKPLNASQAQNYHAIEFTSPDQNYWSRGQTVRGEWQGRLAGKFGLSSDVGEEEFGRLAQGRHPGTGEQLVQHRQVHEYRNALGEMVKSVEHRAGWDATFSAPKSVSLTALVGGDDRVRMAHREAVTTALTELERYTQARMGGNHPAETTGLFVAAKFEHDTARPVDGYAAPQLHTHTVIFNLTERDDGSPRALQPQSLFASQQFATAVYQSELTYRLRNLGYDITTGRSGAPEIKGYTQEYLDASSPRSQQIRAYLERHGFQGFESAEIAAHSTRDAKRILSPAEVLIAHRRLAAEFGNQADQAVAAARARSLAISDPPRPEHMQMRIQESVTWARDKVFEREAVGDERTIFRDALRRGMGEIRYPQIRANFESRQDAGEFQRIQGPKHASGRLFTTRQVLGAERDVIHMMRDGQNQAPQIMSIQQAIAHTDSQSHLNSGQRRAVEEVLVSCDRIQGLQGFAGVGKSGSLSAIREAAGQVGYRVEGFAPTSRAARQLRDAGIPADTLQGFLVRGHRTDPDSRHLYMVDEASLASTQQMREFLTRICRQDRVLLIGDTRQHQGVEAGKPFEQLVQAGMRTAQLDQIVRQKDPELKAVVEYLAHGKITEGIELLQRQGKVTEIADPNMRIQTIARDYASHPARTLIVSPDNASRRQINDAVRSELQIRGMVAAENHALHILIPRQELTGAERQWASSYQVQDVLRYACGSKENDIERNSYTRVVAVNSAQNLLTVERADGELITYDPRRLHGVSVYQEIDRVFAVGDRIQFTAPDRRLEIANRDLAVIEKVSSNGEFTARLDNGKMVTFSSQDNPHLDHGYAMTSHSSQGITADRVLIHVDSGVHPDLISSRFAYVAISRASLDARIYTNHAASLGQQLSHEVSKSAAIEIAPSLGHAPAEFGQGIRL